ncbi:hypothetical protein B0H10DRAFT_2106251, partial [Mycena sp. CBHHK59/15]
SAICRSALVAGLQVTSVRYGPPSSGRPYMTPKGHSPAWTAKVDWQQGDALRPETFAHLLDGAGGVVHTLGVLLEDAAYKRAVRDGDMRGLLRALAGGGRNPLAQTAADAPTYEAVNRDSALRVCAAFLASRAPADVGVRPFVYISAEDVFRPWVPARYIETKRGAERGIDALLGSQGAQFRAVYLRPSAPGVPPAHRPLTTPAAALLDVSSRVHARLPDALRARLRDAVEQLPRVSHETPSAIASVAHALLTPPMHVDQVGAAAVQACVRGDVRGVVGVRQMRALIGWEEVESEIERRVVEN